MFQKDRAIHQITNAASGHRWLIRILTYSRTLSLQLSKHEGKINQLKKIRLLHCRIYIMYLNWNVQIMYHFGKLKLVFHRQIVYGIFS